MVPSYDISKTVPYTLASDTDETKTIFHIGVIDAKADAYLNTQFRMIQMRGTGKKDEKGMPEMEPLITIDRENKEIEIVALALKSVDNFPAKLTFAEKQYPFGVRRALTEESINLLKPYVAELAAAIQNENTFAGDAEKN